MFVVDNGTTRDDGVAELPRRHPWITLIANQTNLGFSRANNQAVRRAVGRYVLLLNNDTIQTANALAAAVGYMDSHPEVGALGIQHLNDDDDRSSQASAFRFSNPRQEVLGLLGLTLGHDLTVWPGGSDAGRDVDWVCGSFLLMRRATLEQVGELDERFFIYDEDIDWCVRAHQSGWQVHFWPAVSMVHVGHAAMPFMKDKTFVHFRSHLSFLRKHHGALLAGAFYLAMLLRMTGGTAAAALRWVLRRASREAFAERLRRQTQFALLRPGRSGG